MVDQETQNGDMLNRAAVFYDNLGKAASSAAAKVSQDLDAVIHIGEIKGELRHIYRQLEDIEQWLSNKRRCWLSFWSSREKRREKSTKRAERVLAITLFDFLADELGMPHYDILRAQ